MTEDDLQKSVALYLDHTGHTWFHPPNGGYRSGREAAKLKAMGVKPGVPDIIILDIQTAIELKVGKNKQTQAQVDWQHKLEELGWNYHVCRSLDEVIETLNKSQK